MSRRSRNTGAFSSDIRYRQNPSTDIRSVTRHSQNTNSKSQFSSSSDRTHPPTCALQQDTARTVIIYYFASATVAVGRFQPYDLRHRPLRGHVSTMWFMVCRWPQSQEGGWARPHLCKLARHGPWPVRKRFIRDHVWWGRSKPGCWTVGSIATVWLTTEADDQSSLHCVIVSTNVMSDHIQPACKVMLVINLAVNFPASEHHEPWVVPTDRSNELWFYVPLDTK